MKKRFVILLLTGLLALPACIFHKKTIVAEAPAEALSMKTTEPAVTELPYNEIGSDPFHIEEVKVIGDKLRVVVSYGGGCGTVNWQVFYNNLVRKSFPPQTDLLLTLKDEDPCRAIVTDTLHIGLGQLESMARGGGVVLRLLPWEERITYALPLN
jgi:hypothetical protein